MSSGNSRYSVISLFKEYNEIKIPIIQRDYAQGRESAKEIRKNFLNSIKNSLNKQLHLDFIYGSVKEHNGRKVLILLDGQQRITTLFLLYWYAAIREGKINEFQKLFCFRKESIIKSKLRYEVRASSEDFLDEIVSHTDIRFESEIKPSEIIKDKSWFYLGWLRDPTISGMLNMIDDIDETFRNEADLFNLLYNDDLPKITFDFLEMNNFGLTDDLYIKMNSRGKLLTPYENFKAKFEKLIEKHFEKEKFIEIAHKFDKDYMDIFWKYAKRDKKTQEQDIARLTDGYMYWFFYNLTLNLYAINNETDLLNNYSKIDDFIQENSLVSFFTKVYKSKKEIDNLIEFSDYLCSNSQDLPEQLKDILRENPTLWDRVRFYAYYLGIIKHKDDEHWYRVLKNLINNTLIQSLEEYIKALKAIKKLSDDLNGQKILDHIKTKEKFIDFFSQNQQTEEMLKAKLINKDSSWESEIIRAENHWYLDGKIGFLIEFSKNGNDYDLERFKNYRDKFIKLWDFVRETKENQILLYQALLSKGDYLPKVGQNKTFCSFETGIRAKSENWHRVFESDKKEYLKSLLDDINLTHNIENELNHVIKTEVTGVSDWRKCFIENPDYIKEYCEKLQLRFSDKGKIYLLKFKKISGRHVELHLWHLFNKCFGLKSDRKEKWKLEGKKACDPFNYTEYVESTSYDEPYILLRGFKYKSGSEEYDLELRIIYENEKFQFNFIDLNGKNISSLNIKINEHEIIKEGAFSMPQEDENCCEWLIKQISKKPNRRRDMKVPQDAESFIEEQKRRLMENPECATASYNLGVALMEQGRYDEALEAFKDAVENSGRMFEGWVNIGYIYYLKGDLEMVVEANKRAVEVEPRYARGYANMGFAYLQMGKSDEAISALKKAIELNPKIVQAWSNLISAYLQKGMVKEAIETGEKLVEMAPDFSLGHNNLAVAYYTNEQYDKAIEHLDKAIELGFKPHPQFVKELEKYRK